MNKVLGNEKDYNTLSLQQLKGRLSKTIKETSEILKKNVIEELSILPSSNLRPWKNGFIYLSVVDKYKYGAKVIIPNNVWLRAKKKGWEISHDKGIDIVVDTIDLDKNMCLKITAMGVRVNGQSEIEGRRDQIRKYCLQKGYFNRKKKKLPTFIRDVAIITTTGSVIKSDITNQIGINERYIDDRRFSTPEELRDLILKIGREEKHDIIALYRGGREDLAMFVYSNEIVLDAIVVSPIPVVTAIGHEMDNPPVQFIADHGFASPTDFAKQINHINEKSLGNIVDTMMVIQNNLSQILLEHQKDQRNFLNSLVQYTNRFLQTDILLGIQKSFEVASTVIRKQIDLNEPAYEIEFISEYTRKVFEEKKSHNKYLLDSCENYIHSQMKEYYSDINLLFKNIEQVKSYFIFESEKIRNSKKLKLIVAVACLIIIALVFVIFYKRSF